MQTSNTIEKDDHGKIQAKEQYESVCEMVAALGVDYDRLEELRGDAESLPDGYELDPVVGGFIWKNEALNKGSDRYDTEEDATRGAWADANPEDAEELLELENAANAVGVQCASEDDARELIQDDALSVEVRSGWESPGSELTPSDFRILLCTGGPAVQIRGELDNYGEPSRAWLEYQDWSTPWTQYIGASQDTLLNYARCFYFGEG